MQGQQQDGKRLPTDLAEKIEALWNSFVQMRREIGQMASNSALTDNSAELEDVLKTTEDATDVILDAATRIGGLATGEQANAVNEQITRIYEACSFQDLTGQRIRKVLKNLSVLGEHIERLHASNGRPATDAVPEADSLLNGPQRLNSAPTQSEIDSLFEALPR